MQLIINGRLITRDPANPYFEKGAVAYEGTKIVAVGEEADRDSNALPNFAKNLAILRKN